MFNPYIFLTNGGGKSEAEDASTYLDNTMSKYLLHNSSAVIRHARNGREL